MERSHEPLFSTRRRLGEFLGLGPNPSSPAIVDAVERLVQADNLGRLLARVREIHDDPTLTARFVPLWQAQREGRSAPYWEVCLDDAHVTASTEIEALELAAARPRGYSL